MWAVELDAPASAALFALDQREAEVVSFNLFRLAEDPRGMSEASALGHGMDYAFRHEAGTRLTWFRIRWQFKRDEILFINLIERDEGPNPSPPGVTGP